MNAKRAVIGLNPLMERVLKTRGSSVNETAENIFMEGNSHKKFEKHRKRAANPFLFVA